MGGLCSRYALAYMESHGIPHRVRTWISFDAPQAGADIPLGLQYWIRFFAGQSADAAAFLQVLGRPAARLHGLVMRRVFVALCRPRHVRPLENLYK